MEFSLIYCIFQVDSDGDGYTNFLFLGASNDLERAQTYVSNHIVNRTDSEDDISSSTLVHPAMNKSNNYTLIGLRSECAKFTESGTADGYVIEVIQLI